MIQPVLDYRNGGALMHLRDKASPFRWDEAEDSSLDMMREGIQDLKDTLAAEPRGIGLAANQIGHNLSVIAVKYPHGIEVFVNPRIVKSQGKHRGAEGCLSIPDKRVVVTRARKVRLAWDTEEGEPRERTFEGWEATVIQHEVEHTLGILMVDHE